MNHLSRERRRVNSAAADTPCESTTTPGGALLVFASSAHPIFGEMFRSASRASAARARCGRAAANALASGQQQRNATTAAAGRLFCRGRSVPSTLRQEPPLSLSGRIETLPRTRRGFASAVATTLEDGGAVQEVAAAAAAATPREEARRQQEADASPKPRRRRLLRDRPAPITLVRQKKVASSSRLRDYELP